MFAEVNEIGIDALIDNGHLHAIALTAFHTAKPCGCKSGGCDGSAMARSMSFLLTDSNHDNVSGVVIFKYLLCKRPSVDTHGFSFIIQSSPIKPIHNIVGH